jgi:hypothetical protein
MESHISTGFVHGTGLLLNDSEYSHWDTLVSTDLTEIIKSTSDLWAQPLLLPSILLQYHLYRSQDFITHDMHPRLIILQHRLGASQAGRLRQFRPAEGLDSNKTIKEAKTSLHKLTVELNTCNIELTWLLRTAEWDVACACFLKQVSGELSGSYDTDIGRTFHETMDMRQTIEYLQTEANNLCKFYSKSKDVVQTEFSVVSLMNDISPKCYLYTDYT